MTIISVGNISNINWTFSVNENVSLGEIIQNTAAAMNKDAVLPISQESLRINYTKKDGEDIQFYIVAQSPAGWKSQLLGQLDPNYKRRTRIINTPEALNNIKPQDVNIDLFSVGAKTTFQVIYPLSKYKPAAKM